MPDSRSVPYVEVSPFWSGWPHIIASIRHNILWQLDMGWRYTIRHGKNRIFGSCISNCWSSLEDICRLVVLTELRIYGKEDPGVELPHNISALTKLKFLWVRLTVKTLPAEIPYGCIQLQELHLCCLESLEYLWRSFACCGAFPALIRFWLHDYLLVEFPEEDEGALPKLQTLDFTGPYSLGSLPLSLEVLTSLREFDFVGVSGHT